MKLQFFTTTAIILSLGMAVPATAQVQSTGNAPVLFASNTQVGVQSTVSADFSKFIPEANTRKTRLDYDLLDEAYGGSVFRLGLSARRHMARPAPQVGTRFVTGHISAYRLEGSRVSFHFLNEAYKDGFKAYREDLERIGTEIDITKLSRNEQLAYWFNLHNVTMIDLIADQYPTKRPSRLEINGVPIDEAKVLRVKGEPLSLRDIRENIVYANWSQPEVIYGFFRGDIGSPALQNYAYTGDNVHSVLKIQANEFVNSLRGFNLSSQNRNVSRLYDEAQPRYFPNWETDITAHLLKYARSDVAEDIREPRPIKVDRYDDTIADLVGGAKPRITAYVQSGGSASETIPYEVARLLNEVNTKIDTLKRRNQLNTQGTVTIEDIDTVEINVPPVTSAPIEPEE